MEKNTSQGLFFEVVDYCPMIKNPNVNFFPMDDSLKNLKEVIGFKYKNNLNGEGRPCGGTGLAVEMASRKGIPVINLGNDMARSLLRIKELIEKKRNDKE